MNSCRYNLLVHAIPAILLTGAGKNLFIAALAAARPAGERWALLDNDAGHSAQAQSGAEFHVATVNGCMCCTGAVALQTGIVQLLRRSRPHRLIIAASGAAEPAALEKSLQQEHLARAVTITHRLHVTAAEHLQTQPPAGRELWLRQLQAANLVVAADAAAVRVLDAALRALGVTGKPVLTTADALLTVLPPVTAINTAAA